VDLKLAALRELLRDPSANYTAVAVAIAALVTFFLVVILALIALAMPKRRSLSVEETPSDGRLGILGVTLIAIIVVFGIAGAGALWYQQTSTDTFCAQTCHSMQKAALSWTQSPHSSVSCIRCHEDSGLSNVPRNSAYRLFYVYRQYVDDSHVVPLAVPASRCLSCHTDLLDTKLVARNGDPFTHRTVLADGASCRSCHRSQGHEPGRK
jgi:hypothetical protein